MANAAKNDEQENGSQATAEAVPPTGPALVVEVGVGATVHQTRVDMLDVDTAAQAVSDIATCGEPWVWIYQADGTPLIIRTSTIISAWAEA